MIVKKHISACCESSNIKIRFSIEFTLCLGSGWKPLNWAMDWNLTNDIALNPQCIYAGYLIILIR